LVFQLFGGEYTYNNIGAVYKSNGGYNKALEFYRQCLDIRLKILGSDHPDVASSISDIEEILNLVGE